MTEPNDTRPRFALLVDVETGSATDDPAGALDPNDSRIVEIGFARLNLETGNVLSCESYVVDDGVYTIPRVVSTTLEDVRAVQESGHMGTPLQRLENAAMKCDVIIAHNAEFDRARIAEWSDRRGGATGGELDMFDRARIVEWSDRRGGATGGELDMIPWVCSYRDIEWPNGNRSLNETALAHGVGVARAHGAIDDVLTLAALFRAVKHGHGVDLRTLVAEAMLPRVEVRALVSYDDRELAKRDGFRWDGGRRWWLKSVRQDRLAAMLADESRGYAVEVVS